MSARVGTNKVRRQCWHVHHRRECHMNALAAELCTHRLAALADERAVPPVLPVSMSPTPDVSEGLTWRPH